MPVVNYKQYCEMLDKAKAGKYAFPAFNVTSASTANAVLAGLAEAKADGILQVSHGGAEYNSGSLKDMFLGSVSLADHIHLMAAKYNIFVALHTDHCQPDKLEKFIYPLIEETARRRKAGRPNLFNSHMYDGSELPTAKNLDLAVPLLEKCRENEIILEVETGVVGGEEDGVSAKHDAKLYTTPEDMLEVVARLGKGDKGRYMVAATFGNVHGVYKPGAVKLEPKILRDGQKVIKDKHGFAVDLVFHGGSGSTLEEIHETLEYGVIKMNVDTDTQYAYTRPIADHMMTNYAGVLKIDGEVGNKKAYDPRAFLKKGEAGMKARVIQACNDLKSSGKTIFK
jgi:fructose-bisphosphate aldolase, class II